MLILRRLVWLMFAVLVLLSAVVVRVKIPVPVNEQADTPKAESMMELSINSTNT